MILFFFSNLELGQFLDVLYFHFLYWGYHKELFLKANIKLELYTKIREKLLEDSNIV